MKVFIKQKSAVIQPLQTVLADIHQLYSHLYCFCLFEWVSHFVLPLIQTRWLRFFGHVARMGDSQDTSRALCTSIRGLPKDWRRRPGRPRRTWLRTLEADIQPLNHGLNTAWRLAQDRERWRQLVEAATLQSGACPR